MTRAGLILSLFVVGLAMAGHLADAKRIFKKNEPELLPQDEQLSAFRPGYEYIFQYHSQISLGMVEPKADLESPSLINAQAEGKQSKAATRFQCEVKLAFDSDNQATLKIEKARIGHLNALLVRDPKRVQPIEMFERSQIDGRKLSELLTPCQFVFRDGVVETIKFHRDDATWSKNVKRAILNLLQINLKPVDETNGEDKMDSNEQFYLTKSYSVPEVTLEGDCQVAYNINGNSEFRYRSENAEENKQKPTVFNVTKSIDFKKCKQIADVGFGLEGARFEQSGECVECMQKQWNVILKKNDVNDRDTFFYDNACSRECDPKEVSEQNVDRSTVIRHICAGRPESAKCALKRVELISRYIYKNYASQLAASDFSTPLISSDLETTVVAEMMLKDEKKMTTPSNVNNEEKISAESKGVSSILYDNEASSERKLFYMYGDAIFEKKMPFADVKNKVEQATNSYAYLIKEAVKGSGIEATSMATHLPRIVDILRMASMDELKQIYHSVIAAAKKQQSVADVQKAKQILADTLAMAGTKNAIDFLADKIESREIAADKAKNALAALGQLPAPSDSIVKTVLALCKSEQIRSVPSLKQVCLLTYGALVSELCRYRAQNDVKQFVYGKQTGFNATKFIENQDTESSSSSEEGDSDKPICSDKHKTMYAKALIAEYDVAESLYEKVLALKAIGNAGLETTVSELLKPIIRGELVGPTGTVDSMDLSDAKSDDATIVRVHAIDALRRMSALIPRQIQRLLLPLYTNGDERAELKMAALSALMLTSPPRPVIDQIVFGLLNERSREVKTFVHSSLNAYVRAQKHNNSPLAHHIKSALKLAGINAEDYMGASSWNVEMQAQPSHALNGENLIFNLASVFGSDKSEMLQMPSQLSAHVHANFGQGQSVLRNVVSLSATQSNLSQWAENVMKAVLRFLDELKQKSPVMSRGERGSSASEQSVKDADKQMKNIFTALGIQRRQSCANVESGASANLECGIAKKGSPFAMFTVRVGDVDKAIVPLEEKVLPIALQSIVNGEKSLMESAKLFDDFKNAKFYHRNLSALNLGEEGAVIPTSMGIPVRLHHTNPLLASMDGETKFNTEKSAGNYGAVAFIDVRASISSVRIRKMEAQWPGQPSVGVESSRAVEAHAPIHAQIHANVVDGVRVQLLAPQTPKTRLFGVHTLTTTYTRDFDAETKNFFDAKIRVVHSPQFDALETIVDKVMGDGVLGLPIRVSGHFHLPKQSIPRTPLGYLVELANLGMSTENHIHVTFEPNQHTPKQIQFQLKGRAFEKIPMDQVQYGEGGSLKNFYAQSSNRFETAYSDSDESVELIQEYKERDAKLTNFLKNIRDNEMFKHSLKMSAQTLGGAKPVKAESDLAAVCDSSTKYCKFTADLRRSPIIASEETEWWTLKARADLALPERVSSAEKLKESADEKSQILLLKAQCEWGVAEKQTINLHIQGKCATEKQMKQRLAAIFGASEQNESEEAQKIRREMSFLNRFDVNAEYRMHHSAQNAFARIFEALKSYSYWNTQTRPANRNGQSDVNALAISNEQCSLNEPCKVHATLTIDPISQRYANLSIRTVSRAVRIQSLPLPYRMRHFSLISALDSPVKSAHQMIKRYAQRNLDQGRAKCTVDGRRVSTFDGVEYNTAPISECYTVIAKDCANEKFSVLMKSLDKNGMQKKIKILTANSVIECHGQKNNAQENKQITCFENGVEIASGDILSKGQNTLEYGNDEQSMVEIRNVDIGFTVTFGCHCAACKCQKVVVKLSDEYMNAQCGICGHFDGDRDAEFRPAGDFDAEEENLSEFVNSYTLKDANECSPLVNNEMIEEKKLQYQLRSKNGLRKESNEWRTGGYIWDDDEEKRSANYNENSSKYVDNNNKNEDMEEPEYEEPEMRTLVVEYNHKICFSVNTVKQCAEGTTPKTFDQFSRKSAGKSAEIRNSAFVTVVSDEKESNENDEQNDENEKIVVNFACLDRSTPTARRMQREAKHGVSLSEEISQRYEPNYSQAIVQPAKCLKYTQIF